MIMLSDSRESLRICGRHPPGKNVLRQVHRRIREPACEVARLDPLGLLHWGFWT